MNNKFIPGELVNIIMDRGEVAGYHKNFILVDRHESIGIKGLNNQYISERIPVLHLYEPIQLRLIGEK